MWPNKDQLNGEVMIDARDEFGRTPLHHAAKTGQETLVHFLINKGAAVDACDNECKTPLYFAIDGNNVRLVNILLARGASIYKKCGTFLTPLHFAARRGKIEIARLLIYKGAPLNTARFEDSLLYDALWWNNAEIIPLLIESGAGLHCKNSAGLTYLHIAVAKGYYEITNFLLRKKADVNARSKDGISPLCMAAKNGNLKLCKLLLKYEADASNSDRNEVTLLQFSVDHSLHNENCSALTEMLLVHRANVDCKTSYNTNLTFLCAFRGCEKSFLLLHKYGAEIDVNFKLQDKSVLFHAIINQCPKIVECILRNCEIATEKFEDLFEVAVLENNPDSRVIVKNLVEHGFRCRKDNIVNKEFISKVVENEYLEIFEQLLEYHLDVNLNIKLPHDNFIYRTEHKCIPETGKILLMLLLANREDFAEKLITHGADVDFADSVKRTPLLYSIKNGFSKITDMLLPKINVHRERESFNFAVRRGNFKVVKHFLENGYDVNVKDELGKVALHYVLDSENFDFDFYYDFRFPTGQEKGEMTKLLLQLEADFNAKMKNNETILVTALKLHCLEVVEVLLQHNVDINRKLSGISTSLLVSFPEGYDYEKSVTPFCYPLHLSALNFNTDLISLIINSGAKLEKENENGMTPFQIAALEGRSDSVKLFIRSGANLNHRDKNGVTALCYTFLKQDYKTFDLLLNYNADIHAADTKNRTLYNHVIKRIRFNPDCPSIIALMEHVIKLKAASLFVDERYLNLNYVDSDLERACKIEIDRIKSEQIFDSPYSLFDVLTGVASGLVKRLRDKNLLASVKLDMWLEKCRIYEGCIRAQFLNVVNRRELLNEYKFIFQEIFPLWPAICREEIIANLSNEDLRKMIFLSKPDSE